MSKEYTQKEKRNLRQMMRRIHKKPQPPGAQSYAEDKAYLASKISYWRF